MTTPKMYDGRILIVDDEELLLELLGEDLKKFFAVVETVTNAEKALKILAHEKIDCVITDYCMPGMNGIELIRIINSTYPSIPNILLTGNGTHPNVEAAIENGVFDYVDKPFRTSVLVNRIRNSLLLPKLERLILELSKVEFPDLNVARFMNLSHQERLRAIQALEGTILTRLINRSSRVSP